MESTEMNWLLYCAFKFFLITFKNLDFSPNIFHKDSLFDRFDYDDFDVVATNPPWVFFFSSRKTTIKTTLCSTYFFESFPTS
jgi:hypothetical protein